MNQVVLRILLVISLPLAVGCAVRPPSGGGDKIVFLVAGAGGDGGKFNGIIRALRDGGCQEVRVFTWGAPLPLFMLNFSTSTIHNSAEANLVKRIAAWRSEHPDGRIDLIGHSAGCGVILGALAREESLRVSNIILLAPSVSPVYDLSPAVSRISGTAHAFVSERDSVFLKWRTGNFGTYDRVKTPAAGSVGFNLTNLRPDLRQKVVQHKYDPHWESLGNDGGHFGPLSERFARQVLTPKLGYPLAVTRSPS